MMISTHAKSGTSGTQQFIVPTLFLGDPARGG